MNIAREYSNDNQIEYDFLIITRYDFLNTIHLNLHGKDPECIYTNPHLYNSGRDIIVDGFICGGYDTMIRHMSDTVDHIKMFKNRKDIDTAVMGFDKFDGIKINGENIVMARLLHTEFDYKNKVRCSDEIPNFC